MMQIGSIPILMLALQSTCIGRQIFFSSGIRYHVGKYGTLEHALQEMHCTLHQVYLPGHYFQHKDAIECGRICHANEDCVYFMVLSTKCVLCETYGDYITLHTTSTHPNVLDWVKVFAKPHSGM